ncbi:hypothetical protein FIBSPDRAFT_895092 [Athelia psychrophila]|uniref:Uncharacterized protein n=1 Tax=Athelia psychrophila TaxID=1759441 RepID=A0A166F255_9AGAM|nr:hypothetical protein FIBSPDRAFT_895092 [Fibularhizoctonia sp. CBS 109695]
MTVQHYIQSELVRAIQYLDINLPTLSPESERRAQTEAFSLQFVGSHMLQICVTDILLRIYSDQEASGPLADVVTVVTSHVTLFHVMKKVGGLNEPHYSKGVAVAFRTHLGAYHAEKGFDALYGWVWKTFMPLIIACEEARSRFHGTPLIKLIKLERPAEDHDPKQPSSSTQALVLVSNASPQELSSSFVSYPLYNSLRPEKSQQPTPHAAPISFNTSTTTGALPPSTTTTTTETGTYNNPIVID